MLRELLECLGDVGDPRDPAKVEHRLVDVLAIAVCAVLACAESFEDIALYGRSKRDWLEHFLELPNGIPSHDTFRRVLMLIDPEQFERGFLAWTRRAFVSGGDAQSPSQIAVDGKTLRRSFDRRRGRTPLHLVGAFATASGLVLAQRRTADKGGEPAVLEDLLAGLDLRGALVSLDAASCHPGVAATITGHGADYLIALKGNRRALHGAVRDWFSMHAFAADGTLRPCSDTWDDQHGRLVRRRVFVAAVAELPDATGLVAAWPSLRRIVAVEAIRSVGIPAPGAPQGVSCQTRYFLTSSAAPGEHIAKAVRAHWAIENRLHWVIDTGFSEDHSRVRDRNAAANLAVLRRIALNLVRADRSRPGSLKGKRKMAGWDNAFMHRLIAP
jgi:predicted transposase YbfD/YdcC